jgi:CRP/FNR family transcriptional regulator
MDFRESYSGCTIHPFKCRCFEKLTPDELRQFNERSVKVNYRKGELICKQGSLASYVFFMDQGLAKVFLDDGVNSLVLKIIPNGNLIGLSSISEGVTTYQYSAMAYVDSVVRQIDINFFKQALLSNPAFAKEIIDILGANSAQINGRFFCLTHKQSYGRLADILLCLADRIFLKSEFELPLSRKDIAELSGLSPETVIRMLKKFSEEGLIELTGKTFRILNYDKLRHISETG